MLDLLWSFLVFVLLQGGAGVGRWILTMLPEKHRSQETMEFTRVASGLLVTFTALVLSLLITSVNADFKKTDADLRAYAATLIRLNADLDDFGTAAAPIQSLLRSYTASAIASTWTDEPQPAGDYPKAPKHGPEIDSIVLADMLHAVQADVRRLDPRSAEAILVKEACLIRVGALLDQRWTLVSEANSAITPPFFVMMLFWLFIVFVSFGMTAPRNRVAGAFIVMVGLSVAGAIFVILELDGPLDGLVKVSSEPMRHALRHLDMSLDRAGAPTTGRL